MELNNVIEMIKEGMRRIEEDERVQCAPASVKTNAPLALIQINLKSKYEAYKHVLFALEKVKQAEVKDGNKIVILSKKTRETDELSFFESSVETSFEDGDEAFRHMVQFFFSWLKGRQEVPYEAVTTLLDDVYFGGAELKLGDAVEVRDV